MSAEGARRFLGTHAIPAAALLLAACAAFGLPSIETFGMRVALIPR